MKRRLLGRAGIEVSEIGLGCLSFSAYYAAGGITQETADSIVGRAIEQGIDFFDTAAMYSGSESLLGHSLKGRRKEVSIATKFGVVLDASGRPAGMDASPENVRRSCDESLMRLGVDLIDLFYLHRIDRAVPIEETVGAMADLVRAGKIRAIGLCEVSAATIRRAHGIHRIAAVQSEYSLWSRDVEVAVLPCCRDLEIALVPYSPLGRGFLSGQISSADSFAANDVRRAIPRFQRDNLARNQALLSSLHLVAQRRGATKPQVALAWLLRRGDDIVPIPGTRQIKYVEQNAAAAELRLDDEDIGMLDRAFAPERVFGDRHSDSARRFVDAEPSTA
jgi:aryl-alcohol dehydrogenase-like predicted oxidoreductase